MPPSSTPSADALEPFPEEEAARHPALPPAGRALPPVPPHPLWLRPIMGAVGVVRIGLGVSVMVLGLLAVLVLAPLPVRVAGVRLAAWPQTAMARALLMCLGVRVSAPGADRIRRHRGIVVANHLSFLDIPLLLRAVPLRFLSTIGVKTYPVVGWIARAVGTLFVDRTSAISRGRAMQQMERELSAEPYPALAVFAEGGIGPGDQVQAFRTGAFRLASQTGLDVLPVALRYSRPEVALWKEEPPARVLWRIATRLRPIRATILPLDVAPHPDDVERWAEAAQEAVAAAVRMPAAAFDPEALE